MVDLSTIDITSNYKENSMPSDFFASVFRNSTYLYVQLRELCGWKKCSEILPDDLYQSGLPTTKAIYGKRKRFTNSPEQIMESIGKPIDYVVSVVEKKELEKGAYFGTDVVNGAGWRKLGIEHDTLEVCDYDFTAQVDKKRAAEIILKMRYYKIKIVHCKAGSERSSMLDVSFLCSSRINPDTENFILFRKPLIYLKAKEFKSTSIHLKLKE